MRTGWIAGIVGVVLVLIFASCRLMDMGKSANEYIHPQPGPLNSWSVFQGNAQHTGKSAYNGPIPTPVVISRIQISATTSPTNSAPVLDTSNRAYAGTYADDDYETKVDNYLYAFTPEGGVYFRYRVDPGAVANGSTDGTQSWMIQSAPAIADDGTIYVVAAEEAVTSARGIKLFAINPNGTLKWSVNVCSGNNACSTNVRGSPNIDSSGRVIVAYYGSSASNTFVKALNPADGSVAWTYTSTNILHTSPAIASDGTIYIVDYYNLKALNSNGTLRWTYGFGGTPEAWENSASVGSDGTIYVGTRGSTPKVFAINPSTGGSTTAKWTVTLSHKVYGAPAIDEAAGYIYVSTEGGIYRLATSNGAGNSSPWYATSRAVTTSPIVDAAGNVYFAERRGALYSLSPSATLRWKIDGLGMDGGGLAIGSNNRLYMTTDDGYFVVIGNQTSPVSGYPTNTWRVRYVIIREAWPGGTGSQRERITSAQETDIDAKMQEFAWKVRDLYSQGIMNVVLNKQVIESTATTNTGECGSGQFWHNGSQFDATVYNYAYGTYDTVMFFWGGSPVSGYSAISTCAWGIAHTSTYQGPRQSGLGGASRLAVHYLPGQDHVEVIEHEWEHVFLDDGGAVTVYNGISDPLITDTHDGWSLLRVKPFVWSDADNIDPISASFPGELLTIGCFDQAPYGSGGGFPYGAYKAFISEATTQPQASQSEGGKTWTKSTVGGDGTVDLYSKYWPDTGSKDCVAYAHLYVKSDTAQDVRLWITSSSDIRLFFNNRRFRDSNDLRDFLYGRYGLSVSGTWKDSFGVGVRLEAGWNRILVKTMSEAGYLWKIGMRIANRDGSAPSGITYCADKPGTGTCPP
ncbi:MAG: outer membrane protein assembly factor BamB family protein [bacterium JZ-2024 1]